MGATAESLNTSGICRLANKSKDEPLRNCDYLSNRLHSFSIISPVVCAGPLGMYVFLKKNIGCGISLDCTDR
jgi:hypothetical protein